MHMQVPVNSMYIAQGLVLGCLATDSVSAGATYYLMQAWQSVLLSENAL